VLALGFLAATAIGGGVRIFLDPHLSGESQAQSRRSAIAKREPIGNAGPPRSSARAASRWRAR
jgi:hypothetical protein